MSTPPTSINTNTGGRSVISGLTRMPGRGHDGRQPFGGRGRGRGRNSNRNRRRWNGGRSTASATTSYSNDPKFVGPIEGLKKVKFVVGMKTHQNNVARYALMDYIRSNTQGH